LIDTSPPVAFGGDPDGDVVDPADINRKPPCPLVPLPTVTKIPPPRPEDPVPVPMYNAPLLPHAAVPVDTIIKPLTPALPVPGVPALDVLSIRVPLLLTEL